MTVINRVRLTDNLSDITIECDACDIFRKNEKSKFMFSMMLDNPVMAITALKEAGWATRITEESGVLHICPDCNKKLEEIREHYGHIFEGESDEPEAEDSAASSD